MKKALITGALFIGLTLFSIGKSAHGQSEIVGFIQSSITGLKPMTEVYIEITNSDRPLPERTTLTDSSGTFRLENLEVNKKYILKVSAFGYGKQFFEINTVSGIVKTTLTLKASCEFSAEQARVDWENGTAKLLLSGSIAPVANTRADTRFEKKYKILYYDFGCTPIIGECIKSYNEQIFDLLDDKYGKNWRRRARNDTEHLN